MRYLQLAFLVAGANLVSGECGGWTLPRDKHVTYRRNNIVGGNTAVNRSTFSYQASLMLLPNFDYHCGATIINSNHLLTAAHCVFSNGTLIHPSVLCVVVGHLNILHEEQNTEYRSIKHVFVFPDYDDESSSNDVALIRIYKKYTLSGPFVSALLLASMVPFDNSKCVVSGWGATSETENFSVLLQYAEVVIINREQCNLRYGGLIDEGMICAGHMEGGRDACQGDSGGPLVCNGRLVGIVSWGEGCALEGFPGVYADVTTYRTWIEEQVKVLIDYKERQRAKSSSLTAVGNYFLLLLSIFSAVVTLTFI